MGVCMGDDVLKASTVERCVARVWQEDDKGPVTFAADFTRQDAAILKLQRACEACLDMGQHLLRRERLGLPQSARDVFDLSAQAGGIEPAQAEVMKRMVGFRNIAVHDDQALQWPITLNIIEHHLGDFLADIQRLLPHDSGQASR